jgi:hypothetical protein
MQEGVGSRLDHEVPTSQGEELSLVPPYPAHTHLNTGASLGTGTG